MLNRIKRISGKQLRKLVVAYYRLMGVKIGKNVFISHKAKIDTTYSGSISIADGCHITYGAMIIAHDQSILRHTPFYQGLARGRVMLKKNVYIGTGAIILRNVTIGENSIVGAGSVVTKDVPPNVIVAGNPARILRSFTPEKAIRS